MVDSSSSSSSSDRIFNDLQASTNDQIAKLSAPFLAQEATDPFMGVKERRVAHPDETVARSTSVAARAALEDAQLNPWDVDVVIANAVVPDYYPTQIAASVAHELKCGRNVVAFDIEAACASPLVALEIAQNMLNKTSSAATATADDGPKVVLIVANHLMLRVQPMLHPACPGLGDGAAAWVVTTTCDGGPGLAVRSIVSQSQVGFHHAVRFVRQEPRSPTSTTSTTKEQVEAKWSSPALILSWREVRILIRSGT